MDKKIDCGAFLLDLRGVFMLTIQQLADYMDWANTKYYHKILHGSQVSCYYLFNSLRNWIENYPEFWNSANRKKLEDLIRKHFLFFLYK